MASKAERQRDAKRARYGLPPKPKAMRLTDAQKSALKKGANASLNLSRGRVVG